MSIVRVDHVGVDLAKVDLVRATRLSSLPLTASVEQQLLQVYESTMPHGSNGFLISSVPVQQQCGECDCGLFVIATALHAHRCWKQH